MMPAAHAAILVVSPERHPQRLRPVVVAGAAHHPGGGRRGCPRARRRRGTGRGGTGSTSTPSDCPRGPGRPGGSPPPAGRPPAPSNCTCGRSARGPASAARRPRDSAARRRPAPPSPTPPRWAAACRPRGSSRAPRTRTPRRRDGSRSPHRPPSGSARPAALRAPVNARVGVVPVEIVLTLRAAQPAHVEERGELAIGHLVAVDPEGAQPDPVGGSLVGRVAVAAHGERASVDEHHAVRPCGRRGAGEHGDEGKGDRDPDAGAADGRGTGPPVHNGDMAARAATPG